jgi:tetratricopeptide (TPR) repeat protein
VLTRQTNHNIIISRKTVREALKQWHNTTKLGVLALARMALVTRQIQGEATVVARGLALRDVLRRAIESLRPADGEPRFAETRWRAYNILYAQYIEGLPPYDITERLFMARSTYNHAQAEALDLLVARLTEMEEEATAVNKPPISVSPPFLAPPSPPHVLMGREGILSRLKEQLLSGRSQALFAFNGLPGVGKTALAIAIAHDADILAHFYDGVLWGRLGQKANVQAILGQWAVALGVESSRVSALHTVAQRAEVVHAAIGLRHMLLVVDDAWAVEYALALRLGGPHCAHLVTTRLPEVAVQFAGPGVRQVTELNEVDGLRLMGELAPKAVQAEPELARKVVIAAGGLPLALLLIGNYLHIQSFADPSQAISTMMTDLQQTTLRWQLTQAQSPLGSYPGFPAGAPLSLPAVIGLSEAALNHESQQTLYNLALFPPKPNTFAKEAAIAVANQPEEILSTVVDAGLLEPSGTDRYSLHQSIAEFARQKVADEVEVTGRMVDFYASYLEKYGENYAAIDEEMSNITTAVTLAHENQLPSSLLRLVLAFYPYLETRGPYQLANRFLEQARAAATALQDMPALVDILGNLGQVALDSGQYKEAEQHYHEGLALAQTTGLQEAITRLLQGLAVIADHHGHYEQAETLYLESLSLARASNQRRRISTLLMNLGGLAYDRGDYDQAEAYLLEGLGIARETGYRENLSPILLNLGAVASSRGNYEKEEAYYLEGLAVARGIDHRENICYLLSNLSAVARDRGAYSQARAYIEEGLVVARQIGHRERVCGLLRNLGELELLLQNDDLAETYLQEGLVIAKAIEHRKNICALLGDLGELNGKRGDFDQASHYFEESLSLAREIRNQWYTSDTLRKRGESDLLQSNFEAAQKAFEESLGVAQEIEDRGLTARALFGLARVNAAQGNLKAAHDHGQGSLSIFSAMGDSQAKEVQLWLKRSN